MLILVVKATKELRDSQIKEPCISILTKMFSMRTKYVYILKQSRNGKKRQKNDLSKIKTSNFISLILGLEPLEYFSVADRIVRDAVNFKLL